MKKIVFLGAPDKSHVLLLLGKLLAAMDYKVLVVDSTLAQTTQGYLPQEELRAPLYEFEGVDVACGFILYSQMERYLYQKANGMDYDVMLLDTDHTEMVKGRELPHYDKRIWCSNFNRLTMQRNVELMQRLCLHEAQNQPVSFYKMMLSVVPLTVTEAYLDSAFAQQTIRWEEAVFRFPLDEHDVSVELENQHHGRIDVKGLSGTYRRTIWEMAQQLFEWDDKTVRRAWKRLRQERAAFRR
ncbi:hypothetical protein QNH46_04775 [Paenibacillus woosongensis]|uniref:Uncharacterized protein n=1 Tax=Paenibacillus woosongensis TaxID=307580 RepID=A0AA95KUG6_9BACL|nr:hypothetical protein [Paenibacillus woosongensis]WHX49988.1 hypothetical protein QNH46_04775 [Paenibacillus woosongensis]